MRYGKQLKIQAALCSRISKRLAIILILILGYILQASPLQAASTGYITIVNPVRGGEFWELKNQQPVTGVQNSYQIINQNNLPATWLMRFDALTNQDLVSTIKQFNRQQEIGLFLEITPTLTQKAGVTYPNKGTWHSAGNVFLTGYSQEDRKKLIDTLFRQYQTIFGRTPTAVGAWWIDAFSLQYMKDTYGVTAAMIVADQYSTDNYQIWGQYWSAPYFPAKVNALMPAQTPDKKIDVVITQWAARDPFNGYGNSVVESTYSVQANDYIPYHNLDISYFKKLLGIYTTQPQHPAPQVVIGIENDYSWQEFGTEYGNQINAIAEETKTGQKLPQTMSQFAQTFTQLSQGVNKVTVINAPNPLGTGQVVWYMSPHYRVGWFYTDRGSVIRDMRLYFDSKEEPCLKNACDSIDFAYTDSKALDEVTYGDSWVLDEGEISDIKVDQIGDRVTISYKNKIGNLRTIAFLPRDVSIDGKTKAASETIINAIEMNKRDQSGIVPEDNFFESPVNRILVGLLTFILFTILFLYLPGAFIVSKTVPGFNPPFIFALEMAVGITFLTLLAYLFGLVNAGIWYFPIVLLLGLWGLYTQKKFLLDRNTLSLRIRSGFIRKIKENWFTILLIVLGTAIVSLTVVRSGLPMRYGLGFWGPNGHDAIWHLSLINALIDNIPPENHIYAGETLKNYHYFFDLFVAEVALISRINVLDLFFRFVPILLALLYGFLTYSLTWILSKSKTASNIGVILAYITGSFGYIAAQLLQKQVNGESLFWSMQAASLLLNPPFAISVVILLALLILFKEWFTSHKWLVAVPLIILGGALIEYKAYAAIILLSGLVITSIYEYIKVKTYRTALLTMLLLISNALFYLPNTQSSESLITFSPFDLIHSMVDSPDRLFWERLTLARESGSMFKYVLAETIGLFIFIVGNLGIRILGFGILLRNWRSDENKQLYIILLIGSLVGILFPVLFVQKGTSWNTIQFFYYTWVFFTIFAAITLARLLNKIRIKLIWYAIVVLVIAAAVPTTYTTLKDYIPSRSPARLPYYEQIALEKLSQMPRGVVLTFPYSEKNFAKFSEPRPLFAYTTTSYVSAFSGQPVYFEDRMNNEIIGMDVNKRIVGQREIFANTNPEFVKKFLSENNIKYIYLPKYLKSSLDEQIYGVKNIYSTPDVTIYEVL